MDDSRPFSIKTAAILLIWVCGMSAWGIYRWQVLGETPVLDETQVLGQVSWWNEGRWELYRNPGDEYPGAAMFPGYQSVLYVIVKVTGVQPSLTTLRWMGFGFSGLLLLVLFLAARAAGVNAPGLRACQCWAVPILFPFHFLAYTDGFSLLLNMSALLCLLHCRYTAMSCCLAAALACRQDNLMSLLFFVGLVPLRAWFSGRAIGISDNLKGLPRYLLACWPALLALLAFGVFVIWHGRIGLDAPNQQPLTISLGNVLLCVTFVGGFFLPLHLSRVPATWNWILGHRLISAVTLSAFMLMASLFEAGHRWNAMEGFLRNELIDLVSLNATTRLAWGLAMGATLLSCLQMSLQLFPSDSLAQIKATTLSVYGYWAIRLLPVLLIEPRYSIVPLVLWMMLRRENKPVVEWCLLAYLSFVSMIVFWLISGQRMML